jgi:four helix bundle protein
MYEDLIVWQKAYEFTLHIYKLTKNFPREEVFGITSQIRRAASSIPANIAEGNMRQTKKEFKQFLYMARGSMSEVEVWLKLSKDLNYLEPKPYSSLREECAEVGRLLNGLIKSLKQETS